MFCDLLNLSIESLALMEASYFLVRFLQAFDVIENSDPPGPILYDLNILNRSASGVKVRLHAASL